MRDFADFFAPKRCKSSTSNRLLSQNTMRGLSLVLASHSFVTLVNLSLFSYKFAIFLCKFAIFFIQIRYFLALAHFSLSCKARLISPNLPILMCCFCRLRTKFLTKFLHHRDKLLPITPTNFPQAQLNFLVTAAQNNK